MYRMMDHFFTDSSPARSKDMFKVDLQDNEDGYIIEADLPGAKKKDLNITMDDEHLTISFEKKEEKDESDEDKNYVHKERVYSAMKRIFYLPNADGKSVEASLKEGVLKLTIPKKEIESNKIDIEVK